MRGRHYVLEFEDRREERSGRRKHDNCLEAPKSCLTNGDYSVSLFGRLVGVDLVLREA